MDGRSASAEEGEIGYQEKPEARSFQLLPSLAAWLAGCLAAWMRAAWYLGASRADGDLLVLARARSSPSLARALGGLTTLLQAASRPGSSQPASPAMAGCLPACLAACWLAGCLGGRERAGASDRAPDRPQPPAGHLPSSSASCDKSTRALLNIGYSI